MLRLSNLLALAAIFYCALAETIVSDNLGNFVTLPLTGGNSTAAISNVGALVSTSPYELRVYVNNGHDGQDSTSNPVQNVKGAKEHFWFHRQEATGTQYGNATLVQSHFSPSFTTENMIAANPVQAYLGSEALPTNTTGLYTFRFTIPTLAAIEVALTYVNSGAPQPVVDRITIHIANPAVVVGDPQFVGLRGQSFQVHGIDGAVYNIVTEKNTQVNSRFVFLSEGQCPILDGVVDTNCWSHPGSYLGEMSFQQVVNGKLHQLLVVSGSAATGFASITLDDRAMSVGESFADGTFSVSMTSTHRVSIQTESFSFELSNSDMFINQAVSNRIALNKIKAHGLLGVTRLAKVYSGTNRYIEGEIDDYLIADNTIFGTDFVFNAFAL